MPYAVALCLLLVLLLTGMALRRPDRRRLPWRLGAGVMAVLGLGLAAFPPVRTVPVASPTTAVLLTARYSPDTLRRLLGSLPAQTPVWRYAPQAPASSPDTATLGSLTSLRQRLPGLRRLHVLGQGLPTADTAALRGLRVVPHLAASAGFATAAWNPQPELGRPWQVEGAFRGTTAPVWVTLHAAGAPRDSVQVPAGGGPFRLRYVPRTEGRAVYRLAARAGGQRLAQELLPLQVEPTRPLRVLVLAAAPSFEVRFLKNYLAAHQHAVAVRTGLSRGLAQTEFLNLPTPPDLSRLTPALLARFDVLLTDTETLGSLSGAEAAALSRGVQAGTCGLLLLADAATMPRQLPARAQFQLLPQPPAAATQPLRWPTAAGPAPAALAYTLRPGAQLRPLVTTARQQPVVAAQRWGQGYVVVSTATETFPWRLQTQAAAYDSFWSYLLSAAAPPRTLPATLEPRSRWPHPHEPLELRAAGVAPGLVSISSAHDTVRAALRQDALIPEWATTTFWPDSAGWHEARAGVARHWFYVFQPGQWAGPAQAAWQQAAARFRQDPSAVNALTLTPTTASTAWPRWWGYALFVLGAGLLWLEEKL